MKRSSWVVVSGVIAVLAAGLVGCRDHMPHSFTLAGGDVQQSHAKPAEGGYYSNWDPYAVKLAVQPVESTNPVGTQHVIVATVVDKEGKPLPNRRVEWVIPDGTVGAIVEVDESGWRNSRGHKVTNRYAVSHTNNLDHVLTRGNADPSDDIRLTRGQTWCVITSPVEGTTHVVVYAPGIQNWEKHKVFVKKHWYDVAWAFPPEATNPIGTPHQLVAKITRHSDGSPLAGYAVKYKVVGGPAAVFEQGGTDTATVRTDASGLAVATLKQVKAVEGRNEIQIDLVRPPNEQCCLPGAHIASGRTAKVWVGPKITIAKTAPATAIVGQQFRYCIAVVNPSPVAATNVVVRDELPEGLTYVSALPRAQVAGRTLTWVIGTMPGRTRVQLLVGVRPTRTGKFTNCAEVTADHGLSARACAETLVAKPQIELQKTGPAEVLLCEPITYTVVVRNTGDAPATNVKIDDQLPDGLVSQSGYTRVTSSLGALKAGEAKQVRFEVRAMRAGTYVNKVEATADGGLQAEASMQTVVREPVLSVTKTGPKLRYVGRPIEYEIAVMNKGDGDARDTVVTDAVPANARFVEASDGAKVLGSQVTWKLGTLKPGESKKVTLTLTATHVGTVANAATVTAFCAKAASSASTEIKGIPAILLECVDLDDPVEVGNQTTYLITVTNQGSAVDTNIVMRCTLPGEEEFVSADGPTKSTVVGQVVTFDPVQRLDPKARVTYRVVIKGLRPGDVRFRATLTSDQMTSPAEETESTRIYND